MRGYACIPVLSTPDNLTFTYAYTSTGTTAGVLDRLASVAYSTVPVTKQQYLYDPTQLFALTGITDENSNRFATWTYDQAGRGLTNQHGTNADLMTVVYNDNDGSRLIKNAFGEQELCAHVGFVLRNSR